MTEQAAVDPWIDDRLSRRQESAALRRFITSKVQDRRARDESGAYVLNLDSQWGHGKSFFLDRLRLDLERDGHVVAVVNAWETDFSDEPLLAIMSGIDEALEPRFSKRGSLKRKWNTVLRSGGTMAVSLVKNVASKAASKYAGDFIDEVQDQLSGVSQEQGDDPVNDERDELGIGRGLAEGVEKLADKALERLMAAFKQERRSIAVFRQQMSQVVATLNDQGENRRLLFVLVDELDRCRPSYAINLLEAAKHLFHADGVVFIVATDTEQLSEAVKAVYGASFNARSYLYRFFDRTYRLQSPTRTDFVAYLIERYGLQTDRFEAPDGMDVASFSKLFFDEYDLSLRDIEQCFDILSTVYFLWISKSRLHLGYLWPLIIFHHLGRNTEFAFLAGRAESIEIAFAGRNLNALRTITEARDGTRRERKATVPDIITDYRRGLYKALPEMERGPTPSLSWMFVCGAFQREFSMVHNNQWNSLNPPFSSIRDYPAFIELAVQFETVEPL